MKFMFTWINRPLAALALFSLSACAGIDFAGPSRAVMVQGGAFSVTPPAGYCADTKTMNDGTGSAVVLMGRCSAASESHPAVITASIGADGTGAVLQAGPAALTRFFTSGAGRKMLASTGKADDAMVQSSEVEESAVVLRINDANLGNYWRAILAIKGRLVMLSATGAGDIALPAEKGRALISATMASLNRANPSSPQKLGDTLLQTLAPAAPQINLSPPPGSLRPRPRGSISG